jgi:glycosyltransferase involved in cell wall biosynthesis
MNNLKRFKVLHAAETAIGGIATYLDELVKLQSNTYGQDSIRIVIPETHTQYLEHIHTDSIYGFTDHGSRILNTLELIKKIHTINHSFKADVIHIHSTYAGFALRPSMWLLNKNTKVVYCPHGWAFKRDTPNIVNALIKFIEVAFSHFSDAIICTSTSEYDSALQIGISDSVLKLIHNGISTHSPQSSFSVKWPDNRIKLLFIGRLDRQKGIDVMLNAMEQLLEIAFAYIIGAPVVNSEPISNIPENVALVGWQARENTEAYYQTADALIMPSRWEGFGLTAAEAMRSGRTVIASRVGGITDLVEDSVTGILFEPDNVSEIVAAVKSLSHDMLIRMGEAGRERFMRLFSSDRMFSEMHALYEQISCP